MDISSKYKLLEQIVKTEDDTVLNEIQALLKIHETDFWNELPDALKDGINDAKAELDNGPAMAHSTVMQDIRERFLK